MNIALHEYLCDQYRNSDNRCRHDIPPGEPIPIEYPTGDDKSALCCTVKVQVSPTRDDEVLITFSNSPLSEAIQQAIEAHDGEVNLNPRTMRAAARVAISPKNTAYLRELAKAYRRTVGRGAQYLDRNWKWVCPRTAGALEELATDLRAFRRAKGPLRLTNT